ncbi:CLUMA_CG007956, isoform A [Clunio marinus]|uniref:CLUMA_CG007956, isoform A n=1 Tax=Clunio marinus TaxID=568069 RepID=A0A1J1I7S3_9DIPT|nr:CLUMA_CG007956, isoform A [Clunio marinus]
MKEMPIKLHNTINSTSQNAEDRTDVMECSKEVSLWVCCMHDKKHACSLSLHRRQMTKQIILKLKEEKEILLHLT